MPLTGPHLATSTDSLPLARLHRTAFIQGNVRICVAIWKDCAPEDMVDFHVEIYDEAFKGAAGGGPSRKRILVMREGEGEFMGEVVAYAMWFAPKREGEEVKKEGKAGEETDGKEEEGHEGKYLRSGRPYRFPPGHNTPFMARLDEESKIRQQRFSQPRDAMWHLSLLATKPGHEGRGAARALVQWGQEQAAGTGDKCSCSTDPETRAFNLYQKLGFRVVGPPTSINFSEYGGEGVLSYVSMEWKPVGRGNQ